jgi:DNA-binding transcriptional LysR family regulator
LLPVSKNTDTFARIELIHLRYFCAVAEQRSFTLAARRLHVSQSGVSGQIRALEREIGVTLLRRNQRGVALTPGGAVFLKEAREILARAQRAIQRAADAAQGGRGQLTVGLCGPATAPVLPALIREFRKRLPGVTLTLKDLEPARQPSALAESVIDVGFTRSIPPEYKKVLGSEMFFREAVVAALPKGHPLGTLPTLSPVQFANERLILYHREGAPELYDAIIALCQRTKYSPQSVASPSQWQSVLTLVEAGEGVALVPACVQQLTSHAVIFRALHNPSLLVNVVLAWRRAGPDPVRDAFLDLLRKNRPATK